MVGWCMLLWFACAGEFAEPVSVAEEDTVEDAAETTSSLAAALLRLRSAPPTCAGPLSRVEVWRTADGALHRLYVHGDPTRCSHPPSHWYDARGELVDTVPMVPVTDDNRQHFTELRERHTTGAELAETLSLSDESR